MQRPFHARAPSFNAAAINETIHRALAAAGLDTRSGPMHGLTETIRRALGSGGVSPAAVVPMSDSVIDVAARVVQPKEMPGALVGNQPTTRPIDAPGTFETCQFSNRTGSRAYKLYVPASPSQAPRPMVVMLHGCTQSADDFAVGTQMNRLAEEHGFLVVYPEQSSQANMSKCWNWFQQQDQQRDAGEPALIAGIAREVAARHGVDLHRVFVAGLSAGAAMAVVLGETYPDLFAGVGVHSGLPYGSASDIPSAMAAMKGGRSGLPGLQTAQLPAAQAPKKQARQAVPTIVFHGDRDHTVQQANGAEIAEQAKQAYLSRAGAGKTLSPVMTRGTSTGGRRFTRTVHVDDAGQTQVEVWTIHGSGHAWSGGDAAGSYTDRSGPDASAEMARFFLNVPKA